MEAMASCPRHPGGLTAVLKDDPVAPSSHPQFCFVIDEVRESNVAAVEI